MAALVAVRTTRGLRVLGWRADRSGLERGDRVLAPEPGVRT
eukprot:CAMPEP_0119432944 /NCGR_PEP_ID=MMETSP1335-20130426/48755_1 /TAXON_ID=259385 /ORGANISM="Chrysoculter rhomboideus, Strain RCC1486" /LENGTH=40 /DNA_ID= /DNA_START= /DNA_END= /DNA_ORIENTATION=